MSIKKKLPKKLSTLIKVGLNDLRAVEKLKEYKINMGSWHVLTWDFSGKKERRVCEVCLGGAVMANTLKVPLNRNVSPNTLRIPEATRNKLKALDYIRCGDHEAALRYIGASEQQIAKANTKLGDYEVPGYDDRKGFYKSLWKLHRQLKQIGL